MISVQINTPAAVRSQRGVRSLFGPESPTQTAPPDAEPSFEELLAQSKKRFPEDRFRHIPEVVVFAEHSTQLRDGQPVHYDRQVLERIAANCNRRIQRTGNWAAVCIGHTDSQQQPKPLVGFAGPFRVATQDGRAVMTAELWIFQDQVDQLRYYPRPSPEVWIPTEGFHPDRIFLDPIAFLGADAPRLDLGMTFLYAAQADGGWACEKYAASFPAPGSVALPDSKLADQTDRTLQQKDSYQNQKGNQTMLSPEDIQAILKAIEATDWYQWLRQQMAASQKGPEAASAAGGQQSASPSAQGPAPPPTDGKKEPYQASQGQDQPPQPPPTQPPPKDKIQENDEDKPDRAK